MEALSPQLFAILSMLVEQKLGLHYAPADITVFSDKVLARMDEAGFHSPLDYYYFLRYDVHSAPELDALADALVVGETYFFRELAPLRIGIDQVVQQAIASRGRARIWSAACATGEEPATLAMLASAAGLLPRCEIVATDVSPRALAKARAGIYGGRSLRALDTAPDLAERFLKRDGTTATVDRSIVDHIQYRRVNLLDEAAVGRLGRFDLIACRNVLIYFADQTVSTVVDVVTRALADGGRLIVGASESLLRFGTVLECEERGGAFLYLRPR